jgi:hypothetical protein
MKTLKLNRTTRFFGSLFFCAFYATITFAQTITEPAILERTAKGLQIADKENYIKALSLAKQKGWALTFTDKEGNVGKLVGVDAFNLPKYFIAHNNAIAANTTRANQLWPGGSSGLNLSGSSNAVKNKLGVWDGGKILNTHVELVNRVTQKDNSAVLSDHGTHVTGTMIASGVNPSAKGMAYGIQGIIAYDFSGDKPEIATEAPNLLISNHSYGIVSGWNYNSAQSRWEFHGRSTDNEDYKFGYYSNDAQLIDSIAYNAPYYLYVKSAGNSRNQNGPAVGQPFFRYNASNAMATAGNRPDGISSNDGYGIVSWEGNAKNILTVGAVNGISSNYGRPEDVVMSNFSAWGPTDDGRIKPDVVAHGVGLLSSVSSSNTSYSSLSGTSMSSPNASGSLLLLQELYARLKSGEFLRAATIKGLAIHTASEAGSAPGPDYKFGFGLLNVEKAASVISASVANNNNVRSEHLMFENVFNATTTSFSTNVIASGKGQLRATISWTDPRGNVETVNVLNDITPKLVNDLDVRVTTNAGAKVFRPWVMIPSSPSSDPSPGDNILDNVEVVDVDSTIPGQSYTVTVSYKNTLQRGTQAYSLLVSGVGGTAYCASEASSNTGGKIDSVSFRTIRYSNPSGGTTYTDNTKIVAQVEPLQSVPFYIRASSSDASNNNKIAKIFIDYNNNGSFTDNNELVATSGNLANAAAFTGNIAVPNTVSIGHILRMRIVLQETSNASDVSACGSYAKGETQDYRLLVINPSNDVSVNSITSPGTLECADSTQYLTVQLRNNGSLPADNVSVTAVVKEGNTVVATINAPYPGTIPGQTNVGLTLQKPFLTKPNTTYNVAVSVNFAADQNPTNNSIVNDVSISSKSGTPDAVGTICGTNAIFKVNNPEANANYYWYSSETSNTPIAAGPTFNTNTIPANKSYYVGREIKTTVGLPNKLVHPDGGYNSFSGNFVRINNSVPVVIESARLYIGNPGTVQVMLADLGTLNANGSYTYFPLSSVTFNVTATHPTPTGGAVTGNPVGDTGAIYQLNLPVNTPGDHVLMVTCSNGATIFRNNNMVGATYPMALPGVFSITGNSVNWGSTNDPNPFYYFFYNMKIRTQAGCVSDKATIVAANVVAPTITKVADSLASSATSGNQWFFNDAPIAGETGQKTKLRQSGAYKVVVTDATGCSQTSNIINHVVTALPPEVIAKEINLTVSPNPNNGKFQLRFEVKNRAPLNIDILTASGQKVFTESTPNFNGVYSKEINIGKPSSAYYLLKIEHNKKTYTQKVIIID